MTLSEQKSNCTPRGIPLANPVWVWFAWEQGNPGGKNRNLPLMRSSLPTEWAASSSSEAHGSLGTYRVICSSSLGSRVAVVEAGVGVMGSFSATSNISRFRRLSPSRRGQDTGGAPAPLCIVLPGAFQIKLQSSGEPPPGQSFPPSSLPSSQGFHGNLSEEGGSSPQISRQGGAVHPPSFLHCVVGSWKAATCWQASFWIGESLEC